MKKWFVAIIFGILLVLGACSSENESATNEVESTEQSEEETDESVTNDEEAEQLGDDVVDVEELIKSNCASCHSGDFELAAGESNLSAEEIEDIIKDGIGSMPAIDSVTDEETTMIANYLAQE